MLLERENIDLTVRMKNIRGIPGACATRKFTYLVRGQLYVPSIVTDEGKKYQDFVYS